GVGLLPGLVVVAAVVVALVSVVLVVVVVLLAVAALPVVAAVARRVQRRARARRVDGAERERAALVHGDDVRDARRRLVREVTDRAQLPAHRRVRDDDAID